MLTLLLVGLILGGSGHHLPLATNIKQDWGMSGIGLAVELIPIGVFPMVSARIYVIVKFTRASRRTPRFEAGTIVGQAAPDGRKAGRDVATKTSEGQQSRPR